MTSRPAAAYHLRDLARMRRVRDRIEREYAQPLDVEALARGAHMSVTNRSGIEKRRSPSRSYHDRHGHDHHAFRSDHDRLFHPGNQDRAASRVRLTTATAVYAALLDVPPQTDESYYVGFEAAGQHTGAGRWTAGHDLTVCLVPLS